MDRQLVRNSSTKCVKLLKEFDVGESLGRGGFGEVFKVKNKNDNTEYAMKVIKFASHTQHAGKYKKEVELLAKLNHQNIVRYHTSWIDTAKVPIEEYNKMEKCDSSSLLEIRQLWNYISSSENEEYSSYCGDCESEENCECGIEEDFDSLVLLERVEEKEEKNELLYKEVKFLFIHMELCEKRTLRSAIDDNLYMDESKLCKYFKELCEGLSHIHEHRIIHRDLKPENIFLNSADIIKIGDFNLSRQLSVNDTGEVEYSGSLSECGTTMYIAPEVYGKRPHYDSKVDIYSLGVIYFEMCSEPMTNMEKSKLFPLTDQKLNLRSFGKDAHEKRSLIKTLLHPNSEKRPTCADILTLLNSKKSMDQLRVLMQQKEKLCHPPQIKQYRQTLKSYNANYSNYFLKIATEIFELHGAVNIPMPIFLPSHNYCDNAVSLLNIHGNSVSIHGNSRLSFCHYLGVNKIYKFRRYSTGKIFEENIFLPVENQECTFESVTPDKDDFVNDAETVYITQKILEITFMHERKRIMFYINHELLFRAILQHFEVIPNDVVALINILMSIKDITCKQQIRSKFSNFLLKPDVVEQIVKLCEPINIAAAIESFSFRNRSLTKAFKQFTKFIDNAKQFGLNINDIFVAPLLITQKHSSGMMVQVLMKLQSSSDPVVVASGERFDNMLQKYMRVKRSRKRPVKAIGVSFDVSNIVKLLQQGSPLIKKLDQNILIVIENKSLAIPLMMRLWSIKMKCDVVKEIDHVILGGLNIYSRIIRVNSNNYITILLGDGQTIIENGLRTLNELLSLDLDFLFSDLHDYNQSLLPVN